MLLAVSPVCGMDFKISLPGFSRKGLRLKLLLAVSSRRLIDRNNLNSLSELRKEPHPIRSLKFRCI